VKEENYRRIERAYGRSTAPSRCRTPSIRAAVRRTSRTGC
jgi:hypothetical protein